MRTIALPLTDDLTRLADWLELRALTAADRNASKGDLEAALRATPGFASKTPNQIEALVLDVFGELDARAAAATRGYPFAVQADMTVERRRNAWRDQTAYLLCLCLSWFGYSGRRGGSAKPVRIFEDLAVAVARNYLGGEGIRFGSPRVAAEVPSNFRDAITNLVTRLAEGDGPRARPLKASKDQGLDVIAWRAHADGRPGKLVLFGACASGSKWRDKIDELNVDHFLNEWILTRPVIDPIKAFFIPYRLRDSIDFRSLSRRGGILFDRCRIASWTPRLPGPAGHGDGVAWARAQIA